MSLTVEQLHKSFGRVAALRGVTLEARAGEFLALLGPSGAGKTTLLRVLAGLEAPDRGAVRLDGADFLALGPRQRRVGLVFQHYALFPHMTVARNVAFGLEARRRAARPTSAAIAERVRSLLSLVRIADLEDRYPAQLSGGQRQRAALARALAVEPRLLLLDEPLGALDAKVRGELRAELRRLHDAAGGITLLVTHDRDEAMTLADRVAVMREGRIEQIDAPEMLEAAPASPFVFEFLGEVNRAPCEVDGAVARFVDFVAPLAGPSTAKRRAVGLFRPCDTRLALPDGSEGMMVRVVAVSRRGLIRRIECEGVDGALFIAELPESLAAPFAVGAPARLTARRAVIGSASA